MPIAQLELHERTEWMPTIQVGDDLETYYEADSFVEPWRKPETILLVHGVGGDTTEWYGWMPILTQKYEVLRIDLRGWGRSTIPEPGFPWSMTRYAADLKAFLDATKREKVHFVGTKLGGRVGLHFARDYPERLRSLTLVCTPMSIKRSAGDVGDRFPKTEDGHVGVERWARATMGERLGAGAPPEMIEWWIEHYAACAPHVMSEVLRSAVSTEEYELLPHVASPTLIIDSTAFTSEEAIRRWQPRLRDSKLVMIPVTNEGREISASKPQACATAVIEFLQGLKTQGGGREG